MDRQSDRWLLDFLENSCTLDLKSRVDKELEDLPSNRCGGIMYLWTVLTTMFNMTRDVKTACRETLEKFGQTGATTYPGLEVAEALVEMYMLAMVMVELSTQSLESLPSAKGLELDVKSGDGLIQIARSAFKHSTSMSDYIISFVDQHSLDYSNKSIFTRALLENECNAICQWWEATKASSTTTITIPSSTDRKLVVLRWRRPPPPKPCYEFTGFEVLMKHASGFGQQQAVFGYRKEGFLSPPKHESSWWSGS